MNLDLGGVSKAALLDENKVNNGIWIHLDSAEVDPRTGQTYPLFLNDDEDLPQRALVRSHRCKAVKEAEKKQQKDGFVKIRLAKKKERDGVIAESSILDEGERFSYFLVALENVGAKPGIQYVSQPDARALHSNEAFDSIVQQVREAAYDDSLYAATSETEAGNSSASTSTTPVAEPVKPAPTEKTLSEVG